MHCEHGKSTDNEGDSKPMNVKATDDLDPETEPLFAYPGFLIRRASTILMADLATELADKAGLRPAEASVLGVIGRNPGTKSAAVGKLLGIARANMAPLLARLENRGLVHRRRVDGRSFGLFLTEEGADIAACVDEVMESHETASMKEIPAALQQSLVAALQILVLSRSDES